MKIKINNHLLTGFIRISKNYLLNKKCVVYKITKTKIKPVKKIIRVNNLINRKSAYVSIDSKLISLHELMAKHFVSNPKKYKYVIVRTKDYVSFKLSEVKWVKNAYTRDKK